ncbi:hypothetical protein MAC_08893 [Metarhizium acridum CQMa 102]|uniref:Uncharacterized protein n=1 Tax=Metarhizium acridum (strain CQMa 102) TaxID=655827 RepID=E9EG95_METAQ|nr:uncharacterized protein MAC_08893 [Metarhizium acridum CQMa 102]EFY85047.1 hypothetical protein MAC_08893 [Metarhizium acridum CQMa 102]
MMAERMERERILALYGDSFPRPADGEIISQFGDRYVVRQGTAITKYTKRKTGMGANDHPNEALALRYISENTSIPVPEVICSDWDRIAMEYMDQLRGYISQMRAIPGNFIGRLDHQGVIILVGRLQEWLVRPPHRLDSESM